ncbi:MAG: DNA adenine methylase [Boseongicola sp.]|nr:DNA adenine methylase [Boseongicola sp.]MDE0694311.1 DNA adenine methylase [Boseongicola sp.]MXX91153.1 DNA adenine methylase [Boseongicola sp. SB0665_bin_10]MYH58076.1 DNA adenine methylase [Boseongicola sp. SB0675_bin_26]
MSVPHPIPYQGSKRKLAPAIDQYVPEGIGTFYEPFAGSAAMTIYAACHRRASRFVIADSLAPMVNLLQAIVEDPEGTATRYGEIWRGQSAEDAQYFYRVRDRFNEHKNPVDLLYLICRCVKNSVRFNGSGGFSQSVDKRRLGMRPEKMRQAMLGVHVLLNGRALFRVGDWMETTKDAGVGDFIYMDPPYLGTSVGSDRRYHQQITREDLIAGLESMRKRNLAFALSYDGMTGNRSYGPRLPESLGLAQIMLNAGISTQSTLAGKREETVESLYLTPGLAAVTSQQPCEEAA